MNTPHARLRPAHARILPLASSAAFVCCLALPLALLHARAVAEILIAAIDILFLASTTLARNGGWLGSPFALAAAAWWIWLSVCSALGTGGLLLGLLAIRLPVFAIAVGHWLLPGQEPGAQRRRHAIWLALAAAAAWIALESWQQHFTGTNLFGDGRYMDGALTGPFRKPRAGPAFILLFFPALLPAVMPLLARPNRRARAGGAALALLAMATMVLIGQRMPTALMLFGLCLCALLVARLRALAASVVLAGAGLLAALPWVSPSAYAKLVGRTTEQLSHFQQSDYGLIFVRAINVAQLQPWLGQGFDGFRRGCSIFFSMHGVRWLGIADDHFNGGYRACNIHPHNYYLEAADNAGIPGLVLFSAMAAAALWQIARHFGRHASPLHVGALVGTILAFWPVATTSAFTSMPNAGWVFLVMGVGFAEGRKRFFLKKEPKTFAT